MVVWATLLAAASAASTPDGCREAYEALAFRAAVEACQREIPERRGPELRATYRTLGLSLAALGETEQSREAFASLLSLDPSTVLDASVSPKLRAPFEAARAAGAALEVDLRLAAEPPWREGHPLGLRLELHDSPLAPVRSVVLTSAGQTLTVQRTADRFQLQLAPPTQAGLQAVLASAYDRFGGELATRQLELKVASANPGVFGRWKVWGVAAALVLGVSGVGALSYVVESAAAGANVPGARPQANAAAAVSLAALPVAVGCAIVSSVLLLTAGE